jgi:hypothetical protein
MRHRIFIPTYISRSHWRHSHRRISHWGRRRRRASPHHWTHVVRMWWSAVMRRGPWLHHVRHWHRVSTPTTRCSRRWLDSSWVQTMRTTLRPSLPRFICDPHRQFSSSMILHLATFVNESLRSHVIQTIYALAFASAHNPSLKTLHCERR